MDGGFSLDLEILLISFISFALQISGMRLTGLFWITYNFRKTSILFMCLYYIIYIFVVSWGKTSFRKVSLSGRPLASTYTL